MKIVLKDVRKSVQSVIEDLRNKLHWGEQFAIYSLRNNLLEFANTVIMTGNGYLIKWKKIALQCKLSRDWEHLY